MNHYRTIWISDTHLGTPICQADYLLNFLQHNNADSIFLVGDIVDGWRLKKSFYWPQLHNDVLQELLLKASRGAEVFYIPGNHDEIFRQFFGHSFGGIKVVEEHIHLTADGRRLWVTHGDLFDSIIQYARWLAYIGDNLYSFILCINRYFNRVRIRLGFQYWSLSQYLQKHVKKAIHYVTDFEHIMAREARLRHCHGVVCGHIHRAEIREIDGLHYYNDGDWVESLTALVETHEGEIKLVRWASLIQQ